MKSSKATIKANETFDITIGEVEHKGFTKSDEWNGLVCYKNSQGKIIAVGDSFIDGIFSFMRTTNPEPSELNILMLSPAFIGE